MSSTFRTSFGRRDFLKFGLAGALGVSYSGWLSRLARAAEGKRPGRACILLWMSGGPAQTDTFDPKPDHENGGPTEAIPTSVPGIWIGAHLPGLARQMQDLAIVRGLTSTEGDHGRGTQLMMTGYRPTGASVEYPVLGSLLSKELGRADGDLPNFVSVSPFRLADLGAGFLGPQFAPLTVSGRSDNPSARANLTIENLLPPSGVDRRSMEDRFSLLKFLQDEFVTSRAAESAEAHGANYERAMRMVRTEAKGAFRLDEEPDELRDAYGRNRFGQGCLLARRLVERGVPFVEVSLTQAGNNALSWDTHADNFSRVRELCGVLDPAWSTLMEDLRQRGLLDEVLIVWMGEFGRTPRINENAGRDHFPLAWSTALAGAGVRGGHVVGDTGADGLEVVDRPVTVPEFYATICASLGIDPTLENISNEGRPIGIVDGAVEPVLELVG